MSKLATKLSEVVVQTSASKGPTGACYRVYGKGDPEDFEAVNQLKAEGATWVQIQEEVDRILGVEEPLGYRKFIYHWTAQCKCWAGVS